MPDRPETLADIDYDLPAQRIAQEPIEPRDAARLLVDRGDSIEHRRVTDLPSLLQPGDLVIVNDTKVLPARLAVRRSTGGAAEILLLEARDDGSWEALARPSKKLMPGDVVSVKGLDIEMGEDLGEGRRIIRLDPGGADLYTRLAEVGLPPLPPYIENQIADPSRYQTVYADRPLSAAAPTAGLHFTPAVMDGLAANGIGMATVELAVGLDTFRPVMVERLDDHVMHTEWYRVPDETVAAIGQAERVVAIGTTAVRALESWKATGQQLGRSDLFIRRSFDWRVVDVLLTNFHLPQSTLLCLVDAFVGPRWREIYETAIAEEYRFLSFGDAMLLRRRS
ncbi:MAG: tRNA preQ1(34) S-adenosylmethionine ribosyltransferase-isomerase QueA [Acidimicrobiales bacterium]|nr:tRNA preQ1(34) S-adenosylmethionine ribosyltransferase-isomerase QueA [Acidimicrobiales bacterium]MDG1876057.1 tRNA preQ1(34) S-adenosylmethionine ribosyltransferase-isomerase QueA [Acidimicrobiales bacterium]